MVFGDGSRFEGVGVKPDIEILATAEQIGNGEDPMLAEVLRRVESGS